jgi:DNA-directed RNA polymerase specialized sigma24 family protein
MHNDELNSQFEGIEPSASESQELQVIGDSSVYLDPIYEERQKFDSDVLEFQNPRSSTGRLMYAFTRRNLTAHHLASFYTEAFVLNEAYIRGVKLINKGEVIQNPGAWLRSTVFNIIRELSREQKKSVSLDEQTLEQVNAWNVSHELEADWEADYRAVFTAFQMLDPPDQRLLNLKIVEIRSWREIREIMRVEGHGDHSEVNLRKKKERALIKLRKKYHSIKPGEFPGE